MHGDAFTRLLNLDLDTSDILLRLPDLLFGPLGLREGVLVLVLLLGDGALELGHHLPARLPLGLQLVEGNPLVRDQGHHLLEVTGQELVVLPEGAYPLPVGDGTPPQLPHPLITAALLADDPLRGDQVIDEGRQHRLIPAYQLPDAGNRGTGVLVEGDLTLQEVF